MTRDGNIEQIAIGNGIVQVIGYTSVELQGILRAAGKYSSVKSKTWATS